MMEEREGELLLLKGPHRRRDRHLTRGPGLENERLRPDVRQIEQLEEPVKDVDLLGVAVGVEKQRVLERKNVLGAEAEDSLPLQLQFMREPLHLRPVGGRLVAHDQRDQRIALARTQGGQTRRGSSGSWRRPYRQSRDRHKAD
jgi:hypothetical protein